MYLNNASCLGVLLFCTILTLNYGLQSHLHPDWIKSNSQTECLSSVVQNIVKPKCYIFSMLSKVFLDLITHKMELLFVLELINYFVVYKIYSWLNKTFQQYQMPTVNPSNLSCVKLEHKVVKIGLLDFDILLFCLIPLIMILVIIKFTQILYVFVVFGKKMH